MPLIKGKKATTKEGVSENIRREKSAGRSQEQSVAIAMRIKDDAEKGKRSKKHKK